MDVKLMMMMMTHKLSDVCLEKRTKPVIMKAPELPELKAGCAQESRADSENNWGASPNNYLIKSNLKTVQFDAYT